VIFLSAMVLLIGHQEEYPVWPSHSGPHVEILEKSGNVTYWSWKSWKLWKVRETVVCLWCAVAVAIVTK